MHKDLVPEFVFDAAYKERHKVPTADSNSRYFCSWRICGIPAVNDALKGCQSKSDVIVSDFCHAKARGEGVYGFSVRKDPNHKLVVTGATYSIYDECKLTWDGLIKPQMAYYEEDMFGDTNIHTIDACKGGASSILTELKRRQSKAEIFICAVHRGATIAKMKAGWDRWKYQQWSTACTERTDQRSPKAGRARPRGKR